MTNAPYYSDDLMTLFHGDCLEVLKTFENESVDAVFTSPPYAMQRKATYGGIPEALYPDWTVRWMREVRRVLTPSGSVVINIRPNVRDGQISDYTLRTRLALRDDGWCEIEEIIWNKKGGAPLGAVRRPRRSWESLHWFAKDGRPYCDPKAAGNLTTKIGISGGRTGAHIATKQTLSNGREDVARARVADVVSISTRMNKNSDGFNDHPAPFPAELAEWVGKLICPPGGTILDPFSGSGSTGSAALMSGWKYIGIDTAFEYVEMSARRLRAQAAN